MFRNTVSRLWAGLRSVSTVASAPLRTGHVAYARSARTLHAAVPAGWQTRAQAGGAVAAVVAGAATALGSAIALAAGDDSTGGAQDAILHAALSRSSFRAVPLDQWRKSRQPHHFVANTLQGKGKIEDVRLWVAVDGQVVVCAVNLGDDLVGHPGTVHGGMTATLADQLFGVLYSVCGNDGKGFTAHLGVDYKRPWMAGQPAVFIARVIKKQGRKYMFEGEFLHAQSGHVIAKADALFVRARKPGDH